MNLCRVPYSPYWLHMQQTRGIWMYSTHHIGYIHSTTVWCTVKSGCTDQTSGFRSLDVQYSPHWLHTQLTRGVWMHSTHHGGYIHSQQGVSGSTVRTHHIGYIHSQQGASGSALLTILATYS